MANLSELRTCPVSQQVSLNIFMYLSCSTSVPSSQPWMPKSSAMFSIPEQNLKHLVYLELEYILSAGQSKLEWQVLKSTIWWVKSCEKWWRYLHKWHHTLWRWVLPTNLCMISSIVVVWWWSCLIAMLRSFGFKQTHNFPLDLQLYLRLENQSATGMITPRFFNWKSYCFTKGLTTIGYFLGALMIGVTL